jgi:hypothetical protein
VGRDNPERLMSIFSDLRREYLRNVFSQILAVRQLILQR